ncbi:mannose-P-dolichol utilization defect 1 protein homolog [Daktulosphaira vitifoliae]|uniref:mannose-P-dolichol utilization defect 1 protein homolog n=1 Tax=Daktulosphaira vitifoliae TaxID=58002 RepID=UPI0021A9959E|nr:mannose-P-dolichol utilization defect 1 protein homolog [Daktulosphaira vitifoliae]
MEAVSDFIQRILLLVVTPKCYKVFFYDLNFFDVECLKTSASKGLGFGIVGGSLLVKLPQVLKVWNSKSAKGISLVNVSMDLFAVTTNVVYSYASNFPFSAWGDSFFILIQTLIIVILVLKYNISKKVSTLFTVLYCTLFLALISGYVPKDYLWTAQLISIPLMFYGKLTQGYVNYKNKGTGQLSIATCILLFLGSSVRVFTSIQETGDLLLIWAFLLATIANFIIVVQFYYYKKPQKVVKKNKQSKKNR